MAEFGTHHGSWTVLKHYDPEHLARIALPLGGIGTGTISLGGRGDFRDCEIMNRPAKGDRGIGLFFCIAYAGPDGIRQARLLEGPLDVSDYEGDRGSPAFNHGLPRFRQCRFESTYPFGRVLLADKDIPVQVRLEAFNPLVPPDTEISGMPVAFLRYVLRNTGNAGLEVSVCGTLSNTVGGTEPPSLQQHNRFRRDGDVQGLVLTADGVSPAAASDGSIALLTDAAARVSSRTGWAPYSWGDSLLDFWDDLLADGRLDERTPAAVPNPRASLAVSLHLEPGEETPVSFVLAWHFPNRKTWTPTRAAASCCGDNTTDPDHIGNYYCSQYSDAWDAGARAWQRAAELEMRTSRFVNSLCATPIPTEVKEAALFNLSTLRTQTCFRTPDGRFFGWEGVCDGKGCCHGSCTHVWNYEQATAHLFAPLARSLRRTEFLLATDANGLMSFRVNLPVSRAREFGRAAADGQLGCIMKAYRDWRLCGDDAFLRRLWPAVRKALAFCWIEGGWDADQDGVMEGCQHNTMDVEYYGPNPQMQFWYLGALRAAERMARHLQDTAFAQTCHRLFTGGRDWTDRYLFNGEYYEHHIRPVDSAGKIAPGLRHNMGATDLQDPDLQLGSGCLADQLAGQFMAHVCGLGYLADPDHIRTTLQSIFRYNFRPDFHAHFNHLRSFVLGDEAGLLMASYPRGRRPKRPFPYFNEVMTGFEYTAAVHMLYEGQHTPAMTCIQAIRRRYDGRRRSPFNEAECGHHYARAMASWAAIAALTGFQYSAITGRASFSMANGALFWCSGDAWGDCLLDGTNPALRGRFRVHEGEVDIAAIGIAELGVFHLPARQRLHPGADLPFVIHAEGTAPSQAPA